jgi:hypothetical protein
MRLTRRPPPVVTLVVWAFALACLVYGTLNGSAHSMPSSERSDEGAAPHKVNPDIVASTVDSL